MRRHLCQKFGVSPYFIPLFLPWGREEDVGEGVVIGAVDPGEAQLPAPVARGAAARRRSRRPLEEPDGGARAADERRLAPDPRLEPERLHLSLPLQARTCCLAI